MAGMRVLVVVLALVAAVAARGRTIVVPQDYASVQAAIDAGQEGDTILVQPGTYRESLVFGGKNLVVRSQDPNDPAIVAATILQAPAPKRQGTAPTVVTFADGETPAAVLSGFTITGGGGTAAPDAPSQFLGGGILCIFAAPTITLNVITNNTLPVPAGANLNQGFGGAIGCFYSHAVITRNILRTNTAYAGGAIFVQGGDPLIANNLIYDNTGIAGGGVCLAYGGTLANNTLTGNLADVGGNLYIVTDVAYGSSRVLGNILADARRVRGWYRAGFHPEDRIACNNLWSTAGGADVAWTKAGGGAGNISADPLFLDPAGRDYRLQMDSPCINAGDPDAQAGVSLDAYGDPRLVYGRIDIGAAEYAGNLRPIAQITPSPSADEVPEAVILDGSNSYDPDGDTTLTYRWTQVWGPDVVLADADRPLARFAPGTYGAFAFELVVGDGTVESWPARVELVVGAGHVPVARAGLPAYATTDPVTLDGSDSLDPDASGPLRYSWRQVAGPALIMDGADTARPTLSGFPRTSLPQRCRFELVVNDGRYDSFPDVAEVAVLPLVVGTTLRQENPPFDPNKPTVVHFGGGDCITGGGGWNSAPWAARANIITWSYSPDNSGGEPRYQRCGDLLLGYLYRAAPHYRQPIQTMGHSTGGQPAIDVATYLNLVYRDARYAVNRVTFLDARCRDYGADVAAYLASAVDGEQCWIDSYEGTGPFFYPGVLNVQVAQNDHGFPPTWYKASLTTPGLNRFNEGVIAGAYWSVIGPGKNLQLAFTPGRVMYQFRWTGSAAAGTMGSFDASLYPGRLPEPVTLVGPLSTDVPGAVRLTCKPSANAVRYQLLLGADPYRVTDFNVVAETPGPPEMAITELPFAQTWWTVRVYDAHGSSIYADPLLLTPFRLSLPVQNATQGQRYASIQPALDAAQSGDEIVLNEGTYDEDIDFGNKSLILRSAAPNRPGAAAATIIRGTQTVVTMSGANADGTLAGLTLTGGTRGVLCAGTHPTLTRCRIVGIRGPGLELREGASPNLSRCLIADNEADGIVMMKDGGRAARTCRPTLTNCTIAHNGQAGVAGGAPTIVNGIVYFNSVSITGTPAAVTYSDIQGGWPGRGNLSADPQFAGDYHLKSTAGRWDPVAGTWVRDDLTSPCIDSGDPALPILDEPAPHGNRINLGAFGGTPEASKSP
ncbi:MAG: hypothetical protein MUC88_09510 [Planctomycetes bacterium]|nr:hypothetical protein [Planctomycetota bacterium]